MARAKGHKSQWDTVIKPRTGWFDIDLKELFKYADLALLLVKRNFSVLYKQTILGPAWVIIQPLMTTLVFTVVFGGIAGLPTDGIPSFLFYMSGNIAWSYFSKCLTRTSRTFVDNSQLFSKVYFPRLIMPISIVFTELINFAVQFVMFLVFLTIYTLNGAVTPNYTLMLYTPLLLIQMAMLGLGFGIIISSLTTKYRDLAMLVSFGVQLWMYATPVAYSTTLVAEKFPHMLKYYMLNPMTPIIEFFRSAFLGVASYSDKYILTSVCVTFFVLVLGVLLFSRIEKTFMDTV